MTYCSGKSKGKILFKDKGVEKEVIVPMTPFSVSCQPSGVCGISGTRQTTYIGANFSGTRTASINSFKNETLFFKAVPQPGAFDGNRYELWGSCPDTERLIDSQFSVGSGAISIIENIFTTDSGSTGLIIFNENKILLIIPVSVCNYRVSCDDDCPEGFCKCIIPEYPGYCCLDCNSTVANIRSITNDLKGKNG